jgi:DNA-binding protein H-NS
MERKSKVTRMRANLNSMSIEDLWSLHEQLCHILSSKISAEKAELEKKLGRLKAEFAPRATGRRPYPPVLPKFRNPRRPSETWAGRGKRPRWLTAQLRNGKQLDDFRIRAS